MKLMNQTTKCTAGHAFYRLPVLRTLIGLSKSTIYALIKEGKFPAPIHLSVRTVGWDSAEVDRWIEDRIRLSKGVAAC